MSDHIVAKFGGSSMATPESIRQVAEVVGEHPEYEVVVVSAPGTPLGTSETKVTDLLVDLGESYNPKERDQLHEAVLGRYAAITEGFPSFGGAVYDEASRDLSVAINTDNYDLLITNGERFSALLLAHVIGAKYVDARNMVMLRADGSADLGRTASQYVFHSRFANQLVVPGFYGSERPGDGRMRAFKRGESDTSGAILSAASKASEYHNLSDVDGVMTANPKLVPDAQVVPELTYREIRELGNAGNQILHRNAMRYMAGRQIATVIRNTFNPEAVGTTVIEHREVGPSEAVVSITGRTMHYYKIDLLGMNDDVGAAEEFIKFFSRRGVLLDQIATDNDSILVTVDGTILKDLKISSSEVEEALKTEMRRAKISHDCVGLIHLVGEGIRKNVGYVDAVRSVALNTSGVHQLGSTNQVDSCSSIVFVDADDVVPAVRALHGAFFPSAA